MAAENIVVSQVAVAAASVAAINWLKSSPYFPWITQEKANLLRILAVISSGIGTLGISYTWDPAAHSLTLTGLSLAGMFTGFIAWSKSFFLQEVTYQATRKTNGSAALLKQVLDAVAKKQPDVIPPTS